MPRQTRLDAPDVLHHVMGRGIERGRIFWDVWDKEGFIRRLATGGEEKQTCKP
jgi:putative transposase